MVLDKNKKLGVNIQTAIERHNKKLIDRYWKPRVVIKININRK